MHRSVHLLHQTDHVHNVDVVTVKHIWAEFRQTAMIRPVSLEQPTGNITTVGFWIRIHLTLLNTA